MAMDRWRLETWLLISWNIAMLGLILVMSTIVGAAQRWIPSVFLVGVLWPIGLVVIGIAWRKGHGSGQEQDSGKRSGQPVPRILFTHEGPDAEAVLAMAASTVANLRSAGLWLVEATWIVGPAVEVAVPFQLGIAFGDRATHFARRWPDGEDATDAVMARLPDTHGPDGAGDGHGES